LFLAEIIEFIGSLSSLVYLVDVIILFTFGSRSLLIWRSFCAYAALFRSSFFADFAFNLVLILRSCGAHFSFLWRSFFTASALSAPLLHSF